MQRESIMSNLKAYFVWDANVRWFHWINLLCIIGLVAVGIAILNGKALGVSTEGKILLKTVHVLIGYIFAINLVFWKDETRDSQIVLRRDLRCGPQIRSKRAFIMSIFQPTTMGKRMSCNFLVGTRSDHPYQGTSKMKGILCFISSNITYVLKGR